MLQNITQHVTDHLNLTDVFRRLMLARAEALPVIIICNTRHTNNNITFYIIAQKTHFSKGNTGIRNIIMTKPLWGSPTGTVVKLMEHPMSAYTIGLWLQSYSIT